LWAQHLPDKPVAEQCQELDCTAPEAASIGVVLLLLLLGSPVVQERNQQTAVTV
jgi:hypothetical protein